MERVGIYREGPGEVLGRLVGTMQVELHWLRDMASIRFPLWRPMPSYLAHLGPAEIPGWRTECALESIELPIHRRRYPGGVRVKQLRQVRGFQRYVGWAR